MLRPYLAKDSAMKLLIAGGGTGGPRFSSHRDRARMVVARNRKGSCAGRNATRDRDELVPQAGLPLETLRIAGLKGKGGMTLVKNLAHAWLRA